MFLLLMLLLMAFAGQTRVELSLQENLEQALQLLTPVEQFPREYDSRFCTKVDNVMHMVSHALEQVLDNNFQSPYKRKLLVYLMRAHKLLLRAAYEEWNREHVVQAVCYLERAKKLLET